jgi:hypothetical protein
MTLFNLNLVTQIAPLQSRPRPAQAADDRSTTDLSPVSTKSDQDQPSTFSVPGSHFRLRFSAAC